MAQKTKKFNGVTYKKSQFGFRKKADAEKAARILRKWHIGRGHLQQSTAARVVKEIVAKKPMYTVYTGKTRTRFD